MRRQLHVIGVLALLALAPLARAEAAQGSAAVPAQRQALSLPPEWLAPTEPFRLIGAIHYVGSEGLGIYFIPTPAGHLVIDGGLPQNAPMVADSIRALGYRPEDIAILLNTHAHFDHSGGLAELKRLSGAQLFASEGDRTALEGGFYLGSEDDHRLDAPPVTVDRVVSDGETITLGGVSLVAHLTPGHTRGCTSWSTTVTEAGKRYEVLLFCSASVALNRLVERPQYPGIVADYRASFARAGRWQPDVLLGNHAEFFDLPGKRERQRAGDPLAFVDRGEFPRFIAATEAEFEAALARQQAAAAAH